jgi:hypothetical protein
MEVTEPNIGIPLLHFVAARHWATPLSNASGVPIQKSRCISVMRDWSAVRFPAQFTGSW